MEKKQKCSLKGHNEIDANSYCQKCEIYMCKKCEKYHLDLITNHKPISIDKDIKNILTGFCKVENHHQNELNFFCKNHNELCCGLCITKIKSKGYGQHSDCNVFNIEDFIDEKKTKFKN